MKTFISFTAPFYSLGLAAALLLNVNHAGAQNLVTNSSFAGGASTGWSTSASIEINPQTTYGGPSSSIYVTELDNERNISQQVCVLPGLTYTFSYQASRRPQSGTPANPGVTVKIIGSYTSTGYVNNTQTYNNTTWSAQTQTMSFTIPANSTDKKVQIQFLSYNNSSTYGVLVWDVQLAPAASNALSISGPSSSAVGVGNTYSVNNSPASASYNWSFSNDASPGSSTSAMPSNISWASTGTKTVSVTLSNSACTVATYSKTVSVNMTLPVSLSGFTGKIADNAGDLTWMSEKETNGRYFVVERSADGVTFDSIGRVTSMNAEIPYTYQYTDQSLLPGDNYYRIRHVDIDGATYYSRTITLNHAITSNGSKMTVFPNPAGATLNFRVVINQSVSGVIQVFNTSGILVLTSQVSLAAGTNQHSINIAGLNNGSYFLKLADKQGSFQYTTAFVKG